MEIYKNLSGQSNISHYEIADSSITVKFKTRSKDGCDTYLYTYASAGSSNIEKMKQLAVKGSGLNTFISQEVRKLYARKW